MTEIKLRKYVDRRENIVLIEPVQYDNLIKLAYYDNLTGVFSRNYLSEIDWKLFEYLYFVDVNRLKEVNSKYGHIVGDKYLKQVVKDLQDKLNKSTKDFKWLIIRYGGDEFLILMNMFFFLQNTSIYSIGRTRIRNDVPIEICIQEASLDMLRNKP